MALKKEDGQAMVEFALVLPILLLLIAGIIDFGWIFHNQLVANNASREAARYIAIHYYFEDMDDVDDPANSGSAEYKAKGIIEKYASTITNIKVNEITPAGDDDDGGEKITVSFTGDVRVLTPVLNTIIGDNNFKIRAQTTMRIEL